MATSSSPADVDAAVAVAVAAAVADAVAAVVADAVAASASVAVHPGVHAAGAKRGHLPRVIDTNHGRVRHRRPGLCMCASVLFAPLGWRIAITPNSRLIRRHPHA